MHDLLERITVATVTIKVHIARQWISVHQMKAIKGQIVT